MHVWKSKLLWISLCDAHSGMFVAAIDNSKTAIVRTNVTLRRVHVTVVAVKNYKCYTVCVSVTLLIQHAVRICRVTVPSVA